MSSLSKTSSSGEFYCPPDFLLPSYLWLGEFADTSGFPFLWGYRRLEELTDSTIKYGLIPKEHWVQPDWIDEEKATAARENMVKNNVIYGGAFGFRLEECCWILMRFPRQRTVGLNCEICVRISYMCLYRYRNMCRFNSGVGLARLLFHCIIPDQKGSVLLQARGLEAIQVLLEVRPRFHHMEGNFKSH